MNIDDLIKSLEGASVQATVTRPNDVNAYLANDVIGAATGSTAAISFPAIGRPGQVISIESSRMRVDLAAVISGMTSYNLHLYNITPPSALGDNAAWDLPSGDRASYLGFMSLGTPVDVGSTLFVEQQGINKRVKLLSDTLYGYLVTVGAFTPSANINFAIDLIANAGI
jgi:hypothetical protein